MEKQVIVRLSETKKRELDAMVGKESNAPFAVVATVRDEETSEDYDWDTFYPNEVSTYTPDDIPDDEYKECFCSFLSRRMQGYVDPRQL